VTAGTDDVRRPATAPTAEEIRTFTEFQALVDDGNAAVRSSAERWSGGLVAILTLATGALILQGPDAARLLGPEWRMALTVLYVASLVMGFLGVLLALRASAGMPRRMTYESFACDHGSRRAYATARAASSAHALRRAPWLVVGSLVALVLAQLVNWWAPVADSDEAPLLDVSTPAVSVCGRLISVKQDVLLVRVAADLEPVELTRRDVRRIAAVPHCSP
jgi:hypothetical protein